MSVEDVAFVMLPGVGADHRLLDPQRQAFPQLVVPPWIPPRTREGLAEYAARLAETIVVRRPLVLGGVSLGGMVAYEMARIVRPEAVLLVASCRSREGINALARCARPIASRLPARLIEVSKLLASYRLILIPGLSLAQRRLCAAMYAAADATFVKWAIGAVLAPAPGPPPACRVFHIHGERDHLIPARSAGAEEIVPGAGHLVNLTHAEAVNAFIRKSVETLAT